MVVVEELGRGLAPGAFVPSLIASAVLVAAGGDAVAKQWVPGLADGSVTGAVALEAGATLRRRFAAAATSAPCSAPAWPTCCSSASVTTSPSSTPAAPG